jgi:competence protein ComEA
VPTLPDPTRAEIARRRIAQLAEAFEAEHAGRTRAEVERSVPEVRDDGTSRAPGRRLNRTHARAIAAVAAIALAAVTWWVVQGQVGQTSPAAQPIALNSQQSASTDELVVDVEGQVAHPGIVTVPSPSRVHDALEAAGGVLPGADTTPLNLARQLQDGEQIVVQQVGAQVSSAAGSATGRVNLNTASTDDLDALPGVGPVTAQSIVDWRTKNGRFTSVDDLLDVKGIGESTLADLRDLVTV